MLNLIPKEHKPVYELLTHGGKIFHTDDVFAAAALKLGGIVDNVVRVDTLQIQDDKIVYTLNKETYTTDVGTAIVADIGRVYDHSKLLYDHHQEKLVRADNKGVLLSSIGLIWSHYGSAIVKKIIGDGFTKEQCDKIARKIENTIIHFIDSGDADSAFYVQCIVSGGTVPPVTLQNVISSYIGEEDGFNKAVEVARVTLISKIQFYASLVKDSERIYNELESYNNHILTIFTEGQWKSIVMSDPYFSECYFIVTNSFSPQNKYCLLAIPHSNDSRTLKVRITKSKSFKGFIHNDAFIAASDSVEDLIDLAKKSLSVVGLYQYDDDDMCDFDDEDRVPF